VIKKTAIASLMLLAAAQALAQYKVVGPDGKVTYTDRPAVDTAVRVAPFNDRTQASGAADIGLPIELREVAAKYPVTLYASGECRPCDSARELLTRRGIPFAEKRVTSSEDIEALERLVGGRSVPALTIGAQQLRGLNENDWTAYLDAAGYPKESRLPRAWRNGPVTPLVAAREVAPPAPAARRAPAAPAPATTNANEPPPSKIRF
jgi:glutaredoxin